MKKIFCLILASFMLITLSACKNQMKSNIKDTDSQIIKEEKEENKVEVSEDTAFIINPVMQMEALDTIEVKPSDSEEVSQTLTPETDEILTDKPFYLKDITFSGIKSILIPVERSASYIRFEAHIWDATAQKFIPCESFKSIVNPAIDTEQKCILSYNTSDKRTSYSKYIYENNEFKSIASLYWEPADLNVNCAAENKDKIFMSVTVNGESKRYYLDTVDGFGFDTSDPDIAEYFAEDSLWNLASPKWTDYFFNLSETENEALSDNSEAEKIYKDFLTEKITATYKGGGTLSVKEIREQAKDGKIEYALFDRNKDDIPELIIRGSFTHTLWLNGDTLEVWCEENSYGEILNNGDYLQTRSDGAPMHTDYVHKIYNHSGQTVSSLQLSFYPSNGNEVKKDLYLIDGKEATEKEYREKLSALLEIGSDKINWITL